MSTYNYIYNPVPPRAWSRVQSRCTYIDPSSSYISAYSPLTNQTVSLGQADYEDKLLYKGNILQYKGNSSQLTKKQKYSQLTKGLGPNRTKVFATQGETYTNPNTSGLLRVNSITYPFPNKIVGKPNNISGPFQYNVKNPSNCPTTAVEDGGNLVCGTYVNPCSKEIIKVGKIGPLCFPNTFSDVPGSPIELCWNPKVQTWFPRQRYFMNNSANKWPEGYKGFVSALRPNAPILTLVASTDTSITLSWNDVSNKCIPISSYNIYENDIIIQNVPYTVTTITLSGLNPQDIAYFYVTSLSSTIESGHSNTVFNHL
jgi:Fibronectin type III domain